jgi:hypothetical protein
MRTFWIFASAILLWNVLGDIAYLTQVTANPDALAKGDPVSADAFRSMPSWAWGAYAIAVWVGTAGAIALVLRRRIATTLFAISFLAVIVQFGWTFVAFGLIAKKGASTLVFPLFIAAIALLSAVYARNKTREGILR